MHPILMVLALTAGASASAYGQVQLVTEQEARASAATRSLTLPSATDQNAPRIEIVLPNIKSPITSPTKVQLRFWAMSPALPKPETFRALYGAFRVDITSRLVQFAKLSFEGLILEEASLPSGAHRILLEIEDSAGRKGTQLLSVTVH